jgi:hypothetical protein
MPKVAATSEVLWTLPLPPGTAGGISFLERYGRAWAVVCSWDQPGLECLILRVHGVKALRLTEAQACAPEQAALAAGRIVDVGWSDWLGEVADELARRGGEPIGLRHLMVAPGDGPCYEFLCRGFSVEGADFGGETPCPSWVAVHK